MTDLNNIVEHALGDIFSAAALFIVYHDDILFEGSWGWIDPDTQQIPVTPDSRFDLASVSKLFTATAFLTFVSEGQVQLDEPLIKLIPEFGASGPRRIDGGQDPFTKAILPALPELHDQVVDPGLVTFRYLLAHISGLAPWRAIYRETGPTPPPPDQPDPIERKIRWQKGLQAIFEFPFVDLPGRQIHYSDLGFILLGEAIQRLSSAPLDSALQKLLLKPLGLQSVVFNPVQQGQKPNQIVPTEDDQTWRGRRCWGEVDDENTCGLGGISGHAGLFATARDVGALGQAWLSQDKRLGIAPEWLTLATSEQAANENDRRGLGWRLPLLSQPFSQRAFGHTGFTGTSLWIDPERSLIVACLTNRVYMGREKLGIEPFRNRLHGTLTRHLN
jgi:serine-type D-Ala-D-Ala carboxypeptidase